jgi:ABC-type amino acid transport system permease subunit
MNEEQPKPVVHKHFHIGALLLAIIIIYLLFKVNLEKAINSPQFQKNVSYIETKGHEYIGKPFLSFWTSIFSLKLQSPKLDNSTFDNVVKPNKIQQYFGNTSDETVNQLSSPVAN